MATKPPSQITKYPADSLEAVAYSLVEGIPTQEPNDRNRLGYNVWLWLKEGKGTLEQAVKKSVARSEMDINEIISHISSKMKEREISAP